MAVTSGIRMCDTICTYFIVRLCRYQLMMRLYTSVPIVIYCSVKFNISVSWMVACIYSAVGILKYYSRTVMYMSGSESN